MKPFDLKAALSKHPLITRNGYLAEIVGCRISGEDSFPLTVVIFIAKSVLSFTLDGTASSRGIESRCDLFMKEEADEYKE